MKRLMFILILGMLLVISSLGQPTANSDNNGKNGANVTAEQDCGSIDYSKLYKQDVVSCGTCNVSESEVYYTDSNALKQGTYTRYWDKDKKILELTGCYLNDKKVGHWISYRDNGIKASEGDYKDGKKEGHWITYWDNGTIGSEGNYINGKEEGHWITYWDNGIKASEGDYKNGMKEGHWTNWWDTGKKAYEDDYQDGKQINHKSYY